MDYVKVGVVGDFPDNIIKLRQVGREQVAVVKAAGVFRAFSSFCTHIQINLIGSRVENQSVCCWLHYSVFNLETGVCVEGPAREPLTIYSVRLEADEVLVSLDQPATTPVASVS